MLMSIMTFAQQVKPEVVVSKHTFIVHSTTHSLFSDDYRNSIPINLPENTIFRKTKKRLCCKTYLQRHILQNMMQKKTKSRLFHQLTFRFFRNEWLADYIVNVEVLPRGRR